ncbi:MAG: 23S rRNA (pseudouridine(1915)-N(3))-methyltransferase RlmH [Acidobacteriota bacterium]|nr:23S rRNA (pseudouridine(1915)-N(3))-methyltransferase RlmH [Acidobacteriota bacterium]
MKISLALIQPARTKARSTSAETLALEYIARAARYAPCIATTCASESALLTQLERQAARTAPVLILLDSRGKGLTSEAIAAHLRTLQDSGVQSLVFAVGPADGWTDAARARADLLLSLGPITLPHELARAVLAEQIYRALTILAGHPYHSAH